jgi:hypothetical protein
MNVIRPCLGALAVVLASACGAAATPAAPGPAAGCAHPAGRHVAYVVVAHSDGGTVQRCVGFDAGQITGDQLMLASGIETQAMQMSWGRAMCQVDGEPADAGRCHPNSSPRWVMFVWDRGWHPVDTPLAETILTDGQGLGWRYVAADAVPPPTPAMRPR